MTLILEDGTTVAGANAYINVTFADIYHTDYGNTAWTGVDAVKETAILQATQYLDMKYGHRWRGARVEADQALDWPRTGGKDHDGYIIEDDDIPKHLEWACAEAALRALTEELIPDVANPGSLIQKVERVGPVMRSQTWSGGQSQLKWYREVDLHAKRLVHSENMERH